MPGVFLCVRLCVAVFSGCADLHLLDMLSPMERKRQGYIHELIVTEENYVNDLQLVTEVNSFLCLGSPPSSCRSGGDVSVCTCKTGVAHSWNIENTALGGPDRDLIEYSFPALKIKI